MRRYVKIWCGLILMVFYAPSYAAGRDLDLEKKITQAVVSIAKADGLTPDQTDTWRRDEYLRVPFATVSDCGGVRYCTGIVIYYEKEPCSPNNDDAGFHTAGPGGNARDWYNVKDRGICYQISGPKQEQAEEISQALRSIDLKSSTSPSSKEVVKSVIQSQIPTTPQIPIITAKDLHRISKTGMRINQPYKVGTSISGYDNFGDALCDVTRYDGYCDTNDVSVQVSQEALSSQQRAALYDLRGKRGGRLCAVVKMSPAGTLLLIDFTAGRCVEPKS